MVRKLFILFVFTTFTYCFLSCNKEEVDSTPNFVKNGEHFTNIDTTTDGSSFIISVHEFKNSYSYTYSLRINRCEIQKNARIEFGGSTYYYFVSHLMAITSYTTGHLIITNIKNNTFSGEFEFRDNKNEIVKSSFSNIPFLPVEPCQYSNDPTKYDGDVFLVNQDQANEFGKKGYKEINGKLKINSLYSPGVEDLSPLKGLTKVKSQLEVYFADSLKGLSNLEYVGGDIKIYWSGEASLSFLGKLDSIHGDLELYLNHYLTSLDLKNLVYIKGMFRSEYHSFELKGLENLKTIGKGIFLYNNFLKDFSGFENVSIQGNISLIDCDAITSLKGLENSNSVTKITIRTNKKLTNFCALSTLFTNNTYTGSYLVAGNGYNPTLEDLKNGNCFK